MFFELRNGSADRDLEDVFQNDLGEVVFRFFRLLVDIQFLDVIVHDVGNIEPNSPRNHVPKSGRSYRPFRCKPTRRTFHTHAKFGKAGAIGRNCRRSECARKLSGENARRVVINS